MSKKTNYLQGKHSLAEQLGETTKHLSLAGSSRSWTEKFKHRFSVMLPTHRLALLFAQWQHNRRTRRQLAEMPDYLLQDIGLDRQSVERERQKPFWKD